MKCAEFSGIKGTSVEMKPCIQADLCRETRTSMAFPIANENKNYRSAIRNRAPADSHPIFFVLSAEDALLSTCKGKPSPFMNFYELNMHF